MPLFEHRNPEKASFRPKGLTDVAIVGALPELGEILPPRQFIPYLVVYEGAFKALLYGCAVGLQFPEKVPAVFKMTYADDSGMEKMHLIEAPLRQWVTDNSQFVERLTVEDLPFTVSMLALRAAPSGEIPGSSAWLWLATSFLMGCVFGSQYPELFMRLLDAWWEKDKKNYKVMSSLKSSGAPVPSELVSSPPTSKEIVEHELLETARKLVETYEAEFG